MLGWCLGRRLLRFQLRDACLARRLQLRDACLDLRSALRDACLTCFECAKDRGRPRGERRNLRGVRNP